MVTAELCNYQLAQLNGREVNLRKIGPARKREVKLFAQHAIRQFSSVLFDWDDTPLKELVKTGNYKVRRTWFYIILGHLNSAAWFGLIPDGAIKKSMKRFRKYEREDDDGKKRFSKLRTTQKEIQKGNMLAMRVWLHLKEREISETTVASNLSPGLQSFVCLGETLQEKATDKGFSPMTYRNLQECFQILALEKGYPIWLEEGKFGQVFVPGQPAERVA